VCGVWSRILHLRKVFVAEGRDWHSALALGFVLGSGAACPFKSCYLQNSWRMLLAACPTETTSQLKICWRSATSVRSSCALACFALAQLQKDYCAGSYTLETLGFPGAESARVSSRLLASRLFSTGVGNAVHHESRAAELLHRELGRPVPWEA
jgi:hypothetical protein